MSDERLEKERMQFKQLLLENPNYFGTHPEFDLAPVKPMKFNSRYEELRCIGFLPEQDLLEAVLEVKLPGGYRGGLCSAGSLEYVRFYVDWDGDGDFDTPEEDAGVVAVNVHDIPNDEGPCRDRAKPLSYAVRIKLDPEKYPCNKPRIVKVRAILAWNTMPPAGAPDYPPVWGNVVEGWIQIKPREFLLGDLMEAINWRKLKLDPTLFKAEVPVSEVATPSIDELREVYSSKKVPEHRLNLARFAPLVAQIKEQPELLVQLKKEPEFADILEIIQNLLFPKPQTRYEELHCVGLIYDQDTLAATLTVKQPYGYKGNLCSKGSNEYVAFWANVYDQIEQQCVWRYLGTAKVNVHDLERIPRGGVQYAVRLPCDLARWKQPCNEPVVLQVRAVLSWDQPPSTTDPYDLPVWGNAVDTLIQLRPGDVAEGPHVPYLWSVGDMAVESISGNPYTTVGSALGPGYANGPSIGGGFSAVESPFGGMAQITGTITNAPNNPPEALKLRYKVQWLKIGSGTGWHDIVDKFRIWLRHDGVPVGSMWQISTGGYFKYQKDLTLPLLVEVQDDVLAIWNTNKAEGDGLYLLRVLLYQPGAPLMPGVPPDHVASKIIRVMVDNTRPEAEISLDAGPCTKFKIGDTFTGKFTATDDHIWRYSITVHPATATPPIITPPASGTYPLLVPPGKINEPYEVKTTGATTPCGYVIRLVVRDRTIVDNHFPGHWMPAEVGLCLLEEQSR
jgi:hypothetical protein